MNKIKTILAAGLLTACGVASSQNVTTPYSMYGYGIIGDRATSTQRQMGGIGYAMNSGRQINVMNPASYAAIDSLTFLFDMGADVSLLWSQEGSAKERSTGGGVDYLTMQFPVSKFMGGSVGLLPYSSVGYAFGNEIKHGAMENQGSGGINQLYIGLSGKVGGFSLGFNISYDFGTIVNDLFSTPITGGQTKFEHVMEIRDWNINVGAQYTLRWNHFHKLVVGATFAPKKTLLGKSWATLQETTLDSKPDTVGEMSLKGKYYMPMTLGGGVSYTFEKNYRLMVEADVTFQQWSKAKYSPLYSNDPKTPNEIIYKGMNFNDRTRFSAGAEFVPKIRGNYGERISYRLGAYYSNDYLNINGNKVREYGVTCGAGFPTPQGKTMVNVGLEWKKRFATPNKLIGENYFNITVGVNFNEVWFFKRKIY